MGLVLSDWAQRLYLNRFQSNLPTDLKRNAVCCLEKVSNSHNVKISVAFWTRTGLPTDMLSINITELDIKK